MRRFSQIWFLLLAALGLACDFATSAPGDEIKITRDVEYARRGDVALTLHLLQPPQPADRRRPCVVYIHGGGWEKGSKDGGLALLAPLVERDFVGATIGYRFSQVAPFPAQIHDCRAAIRFLRANAAKYGIDPDRIGVWGASAGGHLVSLLGTSADVIELNEPDAPHAEQSHRVQAVVNFCGPTDFVYFFEHDDQNSYAARAIKQLLGGEYPACAKAALLASPVAHVTPDDAPTLLIHGDQDVVVSLKQAERLDAALRKAGVAVTLDPVEGANHVFSLEQDDAGKKVIAFFERQLARKSDAPLGLVLDLRPYLAARTDPVQSTALSRAADELLKTPLEPITAKRTLSASGDPRDYFSQAPYFWPNPKTADGFPYVRRDGQPNPDALNDSDRPRLNAFRDSVVASAAVYFATGDVRYSQAAVARIETFLLNDRTGMKPNLNHAQAIRGTNAGRSTGTIEAANLPELLDAARMLQGSAAWSDDVEARFRNWCTAYADWLESSDFGKKARAAKNNIGTNCDAQRVAFAIYLDRPDRARAMLDAVKRRIDDQVAADGRQPHELIRTKSLGYSLGNLRGLMLLARLGEHVDVDLWNYQTPQGSGIRRALDYLAPYRDPQSKWPHEQIAPPSYPLFDELLLLAAEKYAEPKYAAVIWQGRFGNLAQDFSEYPKAITYESVRDVKVAVRTLLDSIRTDEDAELFATEAARRLTQSKTFRRYEHYLLWLGNEVLSRHPPRDLEFWDALVTKVGTARTLTDNMEINSDIASMAIGWFEMHFSYDGPPPIVDSQVDWERWAAVEKWYFRERPQLQFSADQKRFVRSRTPKN